MRKIIIVLLSIYLMLAATGCGKQKQLGEIGSLIVAGDESAIEKIEGLKSVNEYLDYRYIDMPDGSIEEADKGSCISLLGLACVVGNEEAINKLLEMGANPGEELDQGAGAYPLEYFCQSGYACGSYILEKLIDAGGDVDKYRVESPVFRLADNLRSDTENAETLMEEVLIIVDGDGSWESASIRHDGENLLHMAASIEDGELLETLLEYEKSNEYINTKDGAGSTPLMAAVKSACWNNVVGLLVHGVDTQIKDNDGNTARDLARITGNSTIIKVFDMSEGLQ